jgi:hypothetical protein
MATGRECNAGIMAQKAISGTSHIAGMAAELALILQRSLKTATLYDS